jgi:hypothetical protein
VERDRPVDQARRDEREHFLGERRIREGVQPHEHEVVGLGEHVLGDLLRPLRRHEQVQAELAALGGDPYRVLGCLRDELVRRVGRAHVVRLVDHDQDRPALVPPSPQVTQHRRGHHGLFLAGRQRAQVDDDTPGVLIVDRVQDRAGLAGCPYRVPVDAQIAKTQRQPARLGTVAVRQRLYRGPDRAAREQSGQRRVFLAVRDRVQAEQSRLRRRIHLGRVQAQPSPSRRVG